jgi:hypothetical protein
MAYSRPYARLDLENLRQMAENLSYGNLRDGRDFESEPTKYNYIISLPHQHARIV